MSYLAQRFGQTIGMYFSHVAARQPAIPKVESGIENSRHANSTRAVQTRKAKYGESKLKRKTREGMKQEGDNVETEGE